MGNELISSYRKKGVYFVKHFSWVLSKKYRQFNSNSIVKFIKKSFVFNLFKATAIIMLMLFLIFLVKPKNAYIYAELEKSELSSLEYQAEEVMIRDITSNYAIISSREKITVDLNGLTINDIEYSACDELVVIPNEDGRVQMEFSGVIDRVWFQDAYKISEQYLSVNSKSSSYNFIGEQHIKITNGTAYTITNSGEKKEIDCTKDLILIDTGFKNSINECQSHIDEITNDDGSIKKGHETDYETYTCDLDRYNNEFVYPVIIYSSSMDKGEFKQLEHLLYYGTIKSENTSFFKMVADGTADMSYTPTSEKYILNRQEICLNSSDSMLNISYDVDNNSANVSGYVNDATLSRMSLFPNFSNWYFSNMYMIPLTLISSVLTALSMMNSFKKR